MTVFSFDENILKECISLQDFYDKSGLQKLMDSEVICSMEQVWMNPETLKALQEYIVVNNSAGLFACERKHVSATVAMHFIAMSPTECESTKHNEIWVWKSAHDAHEALKQYRAKE